MIVSEIVTIDGNALVHNYSDNGFYIEREGIMYEEAYDPLKLKDERKYKETNVKIEKIEEEDLKNGN
jgi:hypothetical protein